MVVIGDSCKTAGKKSLFLLLLLLFLKNVLLDLQLLID